MTLLSLLQMGLLSMLLGFLLFIFYGALVVIGKKPRNHMRRIFQASGVASFLLAGFYGYAIYEVYEASHVIQQDVNINDLFDKFFVAIVTHLVAHILVNITTTIWLAWHVARGAIEISGG